MFFNHIKPTFRSNLFQNIPLKTNHLLNGIINLKPAIFIIKTQQSI